MSVPSLMVGRRRASGELSSDAGWPATRAPETLDSDLPGGYRRGTDEILLLVLRLAGTRPPSQISAAEALVPAERRCRKAPAFLFSLEGFDRTAAANGNREGRFTADGTATR